MSTRLPGFVRPPLLVLALALAGASSAFGAATGPECGLNAGVNLVGFDTASGDALFSLPAREGGSYLVEWRQGAARARRFREDQELGRFGGSIGPGPVFALSRCGPGCLQPLARDRGRWEPLGEPILAQQAATVHGTYDLVGRPWVVVHGSAARTGFVTAWAFRLEGQEWRPAGRLEVTAVAVPGALPAPWLPEAVISGSGLFAAEGEARPWVSGLPAGRAGSGAQVLPFDRRAAVFLTPEGSVYRSADAGESWHLTAWRPWETGTAEPWRRGTDYSLDLPLGVPSAALPVLWFDRRLEGREMLLYTEMSPTGSWRRIAEGPARLPTSAGEDLAVSLVLQGPGRRWSTLFGCVVSGGKPRLVVVEVTGGKVSETKLIALD
jgi:hypothetical protein